MILVAAVREEIRGDALRVDAADITRHVEMAQAIVSKVYSNKLKDGGTRQESASRTDPASKSANASTTDLFGGSLNANSASGHAPTENGEPELPPMDEALQTEKLAGNPSKHVHSREQLTLTTNVPVADYVATAGPTTAGNSCDGGGRSEGKSRESGDKVADDKLVLLIRATKDSTSVTVTLGGAEDICGP